jgi:hypothetical protein
MKIRPVRAELFNADGRTDMKQLTVCCSKFADAPKKRQTVVRTETQIIPRMSLKSQEAHSSSVEADSFPDSQEILCDIYKTPRLATLFTTAHHLFLP